MPVSIQKKGGKYRLVEPGGKLAKTDNGEARDGGGHESRVKARMQARAINQSLKDRESGKD